MEEDHSLFIFRRGQDESGGMQHAMRQQVHAKSHAHANLSHSDLHWALGSPSMSCRHTLGSFSPAPFSLPLQPSPQTT